MLRAVLSGLSAAVLAAAAAGCERPPSHSITAERAFQILDGHIATAVAAAPEQIPLQPPKKRLSRTGACTDDLDDDLTGEVIPIVSHEAGDIGAEAAAGYLEAVEALWKPRWESTEYHLNQSVVARFVEENTEFTVKAEYRPVGGVFEVWGTAECIWEHGEA